MAMAAAPERRNECFAAGWGAYPNRGSLHILIDSALPAGLQGLGLVAARAGLGIDLAARADTYDTAVDFRRELVAPS